MFVANTTNRGQSPSRSGRDLAKEHVHWQRQHSADHDREEESGMSVHEDVHYATDDTAGVKATVYSEIFERHHDLLFAVGDCPAPLSRTCYLITSTRRSQ